LVPQFSISEKQTARLIWMSEQEGIPVEHALDVLLDQYQSLGEPGLDHVNNVVRLSKELQLREVSAQAVHQYLKMMHALADRNQTLDHLDTALDMLPSLERAGLSPGSVPGADTIYIAARLTSSGVTVAEIEHWLKRRLRQRRSAAPPDSEGPPPSVAAQRAEGSLETPARSESVDMPRSSIMYLFGTPT
ncbi:MAG TPA: hypothetical protein VJV04_00155, partial [Nitrospiraceae bacterium]|nr:hypothetical protein [Nitrospiraceae bacterium]